MTRSPSTRTQLTPQMLWTPTTIPPISQSRLGKFFILNLNRISWIHGVFRLQVFHCLERSKNCEGGDTILVDGMAAAQVLANEDPKAFDLLSSVAIESEYKEKGKHHKARMPVIVLDPVTQKVLQIRFAL